MTLFRIRVLAFYSCFVLIQPAVAEPDPRAAQARHYFLTGQYKEAQLIYEGLLKRHRSTQGVNPVSLAESLIDLAQPVIELGQFNRGERLLQEARTILGDATGRNIRLQADINQSLGDIWYRQGLHKQALALYEKALRTRQALFGEQHPVIAESMNSVALVHYANGELIAARQLLVYVRKIYAMHQLSATLQDTVVLNNLALVALAQNHYQDAIEYLEQALLVQRSILTPEHPAIAVTLHHLASVYFAKGLYRDSRHYLQESLSISSKNSEYFYPTYADSLDLSSVISNILGHYQQAVNNSRLATQSTVKRLQSSAGQNVMRGAFSEHLTNRHLFEHHLENLVALKLSRNTPDSKSYYEELFKILQYAHISTTSHALFAHRKRISLTSDNIQLLPLTLQQTRQLLNRDEALLLYFVGWNNSYVMLIRRNRTRFVQLDLDRRRLSAILQPVLDSLHNPGAGYISDIKIFDLNNAHQLYLKLLAPIAEDLQSTKQLLLVKDPFLATLRFPLLVSKPTRQIVNSKEFATYREVEWLIKRFSSAELPSVSALSILRSKAQHLPRPAKFFAAFGEPVLTPRARYNISQSTPQNAQSAVFGTETIKPHYNLSQSSPQSQQLAVTRKSKSLSAVYRRFLQGLPTLKESGDELLQLAGLLKVGLNTVMLKQQATETNIKQHDLSDYQIIAFATHGLSPQQTALLNGNAEAALLLSVPLRTTAFDDGLLTASEIAQLRLNADWVILSTCNNGKNDVTSLNGLERAFFLAGSRSLLISYWNLESQAARLLTTKTFEILTRKPKLSRAQALQQSVLSLMLDNQATHYAHPFFWAALGIVGESGQLNMPQFGH